MKKQTKINLKALSKSILFTTPLVGDIPMHRFFSKRRIKNLEQRTEFEKTKNLSVFSPLCQESIEYQEKLIDNMEFMFSKKVEAVVFTAKYIAWAPMAYYLSKTLF